jgi:two-component sensor histidine kinase/FtsZ-binding cell division protein ZapB
MERLVTENEHGERIAETQIENDSIFIEAEKVCDVETSPFINLFDFIDQGVDILKPVNNGERFIIEEVGTNSLSYSLLDKEELKGRYLDEVSPKIVELKVQELMKKVVENKKPLEFTIHLYSDDYLINCFKKKIFLINDKILVLTNRVDTCDLNIIHTDQLFRTSHSGLLLIQDRVVQKCNENQAKILGTTIDDALGMDLTSFEFSSEHYIKEDLIKIFKEVLNRERSLYTGNLKFTDLNNKDHWLRTVVTPTMLNDRPAILISNLDITNNKIKEKQASLLQENMHILQGRAKLAIGNKFNDKTYNWTDEIYSILGINKEDYDNKTDIIGLFVTPEDKDKWDNRISIARENNGIFDDILSIVNKNGEKKYLSNFIQYNPIKLDDITIITQAYVQDITDVTVSHQQLEEALHDKEMLLKEVHHRVKNNLQIILSLLSLDSRFDKDNPLEIIESTKSRIKTMALIHEKIYKSSTLSSINIKDYITDEVTSLLSLYNATNITPNMNIDEIMLNMDTTIPLGLMINEVLINSIKYAFPNNAKGNIYVNLKVKNDCITLQLSDDGVGFPEGLDIYNSPSLGLTIINSLTQQIEGEFTDLKPEKGVGLQIRFKKPEETD